MEVFLKAACVLIPGAGKLAGEFVRVKRVGDRAGMIRES
jgi:hypothetical protein